MSATDESKIKDAWDKFRRDPSNMVTDMDITAFDPGIETGVVRMHKGEIVFCEALNFDELSRFLLSGVARKSNAWIIEKFILFPVQAARMGFNALEPAKTEGYIKAFADNYSIMRYNRTAAVKEIFIPWAKALHAHKPASKGGQHTIDAHAHILAWYFRERMSGNIGTAANENC